MTVVVGMESGRSDYNKDSGEDNLNILGFKLWRIAPYRVPLDPQLGSRCRLG